MAEVAIVDRDIFNQKLQEFTNTHSKNNKSIWSVEHEKIGVKYLSEIESGDVKKSQQHYHYGKLYELLGIGNGVHVVLKRKNPDDPKIYMLNFDNYYDKLAEAHVQTGHGGRDRMHFYAKKNGFYR